MAKFAGTFKAKDISYKTVGPKNTPLFELKLIENINKKNDDGEWEVTGKNFYDAKIWGERATEASLEISDGTILDLTPEIVDGDKGQWIKHRAFIEEETWEWNEKTYSKHVVKINSWEIKGDN